MATHEAIGLLESFKGEDDLPANRAKGLELCTRVGALEEVIRSGKSCKAREKELKVMIEDGSRRS